MHYCNIQTIILFLICLSFGMMIFIIRSTPREIIRPQNQSSRQLHHFITVALPFSKSESAATEIKQSTSEQLTKTNIDEQPKKQSLKMEENRNSQPRSIFHQSFTFKPFVLPPPIRVPSMNFPAFSTTSEYYGFLQRASRSCDSDICKNPLKYLNQYANWDCKKHPSLCEDVDQLLVLMEPKYLIGNVDIIENGIISIDYDCGWPADHSTNAIEPESPYYGHYAGNLVFLNVPQGLSFQHFIDGVLPKLVLLKDVIQSEPNLVFAFDQSFVDPLPVKLLQRIGIRSEQIVNAHALPWIHNRLKADKLILGCQVPPLHPELWMKAQEMLQLPWLKEDWSQSRHIILYFSRGANTRNKGRRVLNEETVINTISEFAKSHDYEFMIFNANEYSDLDSLFNFLSNVDIVIGPHGGAFYNILFMRRDVKVVELMPQSLNFLSLNQAVHLIIYLQSQLLGNNYYNIQGLASGQDDMTIDTTILADVLNDCL